MATRKTNTESKQVISAGASSSSPSTVRPRRTATTTRSKRSAAAAEKSVSSPAENLKTETSLAVSNISESSVKPPRDEVARLAYLYWLDRGCQNGSADEDWFRAEQRLRQQTIE
jgi:Protein of unknown function (DUF2934)